MEQLSIRIIIVLFFVLCYVLGYFFHFFLTPVIAGHPGINGDLLFEQELEQQYRIGSMVT